MDISAIKIRHREVEREIDILRSRLEALEAELVRLNIAGEVLADLSGAKWDTPGPGDEPEPEASSGRKPEGLPTMPDMIFDVLRDDERAGGRGLRPVEIKERIAKRWWPGVPSDSVNSVAWRLSKEGRLNKDGSRYKRSITELAADADRGGS